MKIFIQDLVFLVGLVLFLLFPLQLCLPAEGRGKSPLFKEAVSLFAKGETDRAIEVMKGVATADPGNAGAYDQLGYFYLKKKQIDASLNAFASALKINPALRTSRTGMGFALLKKGDLRGAESILTDALSLNPSPATTHYALGLVYEKLGDYERSVRHFKEGIKTFKTGKQ